MEKFNLFIQTQNFENEEIQFFLSKHKILKIKKFNFFIQTQNFKNEGI